MLKLSDCHMSELLCCSEHRLSSANTVGGRRTTLTFEVSTNAIMDATDARRHRRTWTEALKREIVAASFEPGASASVVARRYDVNTNQLFIWRRQYRDGLLVPPDQRAPALLPVTITDEPVAQKAAASPEVGRIEIELPSGYRIRVDASIDGKALRRVLEVLERR